MFTQCPDCQTTFRVSNDVLAQAEGRVRCGGCGNAFNALEYMTDDDDHGSDAREATSDQNKQLLHTLDKLAGADVTLEDTGIEWRVLKKGEGGEEDPDATGSRRFVLESEEAESPAMLGRQEDVPKQISDAQEALDLAETDTSLSSSGERRYDDNTILPDDFGDDADLDALPFLEKPEVPKRRAGDREEIQDRPELDEAQVDLALGEPDEWVELLEEVDEDDAIAVDVSEDYVAPEAIAEEVAPPPQDETAETLEEEPAAEEPPEEDMPSDINTQFLLQAEELGIDTGNHPILEPEEEYEEEPDGDDLDKTDIRDPYAEALDDEEEDEHEDAADLESTEEFEAQIDLAEKALAGEDDELDLEDELDTSDAKDEDSEAQDVEDAFATAIRSGEGVSKLFDEDSPTVETIVMEGDAFGDALEEQARLAAEAASSFDAPGPLEDTYSLSRGKVRGGRRAGDPPSYTVMASVVVLLLFLIAQVIHQSRQTLATYGAFNQTIGSIYRVLGNPVTPEWDVRGWQFEATSNSVDEEEDLLTIYSRIANKSGQPLPYPLVHISLTDRWEDVIGSRVLEPNEYLAGDLDPSKPVPTGENFTAVITIESPSAEATGFKLTVCYRVIQGRVRCATQDFKN